MRVVFLVPRRADGGHRDRVWEWCRRRWQALFPDVEIIEGHHDHGLFNRSAAINRAARTAGDWDLAIVIDSDVLLRRSQVQAAIDTAAKTGRVTWAHRRWRGIREDWTKRIVTDKHIDYFGPEADRSDVDVLIERTNPLSWSCCFVIPRAVFDDAGGFDERFKGWGFEDMAWQSLIAGLYGHERIEGDVLHLWHPRSEERIVPGQPAYTASPQYLVNGRWGRRYMYALRRDYGLTDRAEPASAEELARDMKNLERDDEKFGRMQTPDARAMFEAIGWPRLDELRDGAKEAGLAVTVVVHTGGEANNWDERSGYLMRSLASLNANVRGVIPQRVIYSDWGADFDERLTAIATTFGFYVVGAGHSGFTGSMRRMWTYLAKRAVGSYIFRAEDDFIYDRPVDLNAMIRTLDDNPHVAQMALLRGPCYPREFEAGGILGWPTESFEIVGANGTTHMEHRNFWTANPALFRRELTATPWPAAPSSERVFGDRLLKDPQTRFGIWGSGETWLTHIGEVKAGPAGY